MLSYKKILLLLLGILYFSIYGNENIKAEVICNKFDVNWELKRDYLEVSIETDLPDYTKIMVSVLRNYTGKDGELYVNHYFSEKSVVGEWREPKSIFLNSEEWKASLKETLERLSRAGIGIDIEKINNKVKLGFTVPVNQKNPVFGKYNVHLKGKMVKSKGKLNIIKNKIEFDYPLDNLSGDELSFPNSVDPNKFEIGSVYKVSEKTALMPEVRPIDPIAAMSRMTYIPKGSSFRVVKKDYKNRAPWYNIKIITPQDRKGDEGWINSAALLGQYVIEVTDAVNR